MKELWDFKWTILILLTMHKKTVLSFSVGNSKNCAIERKFRCDQEVDCLDYSDEMGCGKCYSDEWYCKKRSVPVCIPQDKLCNWRADCDDGSDESPHRCMRLVASQQPQDYEPIRRSGLLQLVFGNSWRFLCHSKEVMPYLRSLIYSYCHDAIGNLYGGLRINFRRVEKDKKMEFVGLVRKGKSLILSKTLKCRHVIYFYCPNVLPYRKRHRRSVVDESPSPADNTTHDTDLEDLFPNWDRRIQELEMEKERALEMRIVGGKVAARKNFPFIVSLSKNGRHFCGGTILSEYWILSAAHCLYSSRSRLNNTVVEVQAGMLRIASWSPYEQTVQLSDAVFHPGYGYDSLKNDVMLLKLKTPLQFNRWVRPLSMAKRSNLEDIMCITAGWGVTSEGSWYTSNELQYVNVPMTRCPHFYSVDEKLIFCAGYKEGKKDSCQGDSGGPLLCRSKGIGWELYGVVSFGKGCARARLPGAYARVPVYYKWIKSAMTGRSTEGTFPLVSRCKYRCRRNLGTCIQRWWCREKADCWDSKERCHTRSALTESSLNVLEEEEKARKLEYKENDEKEEVYISKPCPDGMLPCLDTDNCYAPSQRCDRKVDCLDLSDEMNCTCRMSTLQEYLCDGYPDCPDFSDERDCPSEKECGLGGIWCSKDGVHRCIGQKFQCDGERHCDDNSDERFCTRLVSSPLDFSKSEIQQQGYLQVKNQGHWKPFCAKRIHFYKDLVSSVCRENVGYGSDETHHFKMEYVNTTAEDRRARMWMEYWPHIRKMHANSCPGSLSLKIVCAQPKCGSGDHALTERTGSHFLFALAFSPNYTSDLLTFDTRMGLAGVAVSRDAPSESWGALVLLLREGIPTCLGSILDAQWILTSAACVEEYDRYYYEVKAGMLRLSATSPYEQLASVSHVRLDAQGELALLRLQKSLILNRWVRTLCKFDSETVEDDVECKVAGWIDTHVNKTHDQLQENDLRVVSCPSSGEEAMCVLSPDEEKSCTSLPGAPLMCRSEEEWTLRGVSKGECTKRNAAGIFTRISKHVQWIEDRHKASNMSDAGRPRSKCRETTCTSPLGSCLSSSSECDRQVDCVNLQDESKCFASFAQDITYDVEDEEFEDNREHEDPAGELHSEILLHELNFDSYRKEKTAGSFSIHNVSCNSDSFNCSSGMQCLSMDKKCDGTPQCDDQSDEHHCSCLQRLRTINSALENDGFYDCFDKSDEVIEVCPEFTCETSRQCLPESKSCDGKVDCLYGEDEVNCFGLISLDEQSSLNGLLEVTQQRHSEGILMYRDGLTWKPVCLDNVNPAYVKEVCQYLGYSSMGMEVTNSTGPIEMVYGTKTKSAPIKGSVINFPESQRDETPYWRETTNDNHTKDGLRNQHFKELLSFIEDIHSRKELETPNCKSRVVCGEEQCGIIPRFHFNHGIPVWKMGGVPWAVSLYSDGEYKCGGTLVHPSWILTSSACLVDTALSENHISAVMGSWRKLGEPRLWSAYEHDRRVDFMKTVPNTDITILHLQKRMPKTQYINHLCLPKTPSEVKPSSTCVIAGLSKDDNRLSLGINFSVAENCEQGDLCIADDLSKAPCMGEWTGVIACQGTGSNVWTGVGMWAPGSCNETGIQPIQHHLFKPETLSSISKIIENSTTFSPVPDVCGGKTCATGVCFTQAQKCDMYLDCPDQADEPLDCALRKPNCTLDEPQSCLMCEGLLCPNNVCVPTHKICDGVAHCPDGSDEQNCNCIQQLPNWKMCDGIVNCMDEKDEKHCDCLADQNFPCYNSPSQKCISREKVCDGKFDCDKGEDESYCLVLSRKVFVTNKNALGVPNPSSEGFLLLRRKGSWYTYSSANWVQNTHLSSHVCQKFGYPDAAATLSRPLNITEVLKVSKYLSDLGLRKVNAERPDDKSLRMNVDLSVLQPKGNGTGTPLVYIICDAT